MQQENLDRASAPPEGPSNRAFGLTFTAVFLVLGLLPLRSQRPPAVWVLSLGGVFLLLSFLRPSVLTVPNRLWFKLGNLMHAVVSPVALAVLFYGVFTPIGLFVRLVLRKKLLDHAFDKGSSSYWVARIPAGPAPDSLRRQF